MPTLTITKSYQDGNVLTEANLDDIKNSIETFINVTKLDSANIQTNGVISTNIANLAVTTAKIDNLAVTAGKLAADSVITTKILDSNVTTPKINDLAVTTAKIDALSVTDAKLAADSVITSKILNSNVTGAKIESSVHLAGNAVQAGGRDVVVEFGSGAAGKIIIAGFTTSAGSVSLDSGGVASAVPGGTGVLTLTFSITMSSNPVVLCCPTTANVQPQITASNGGAFTVQWTNNSGTATATDFFFFVMGNR